MKHRPRRSRPAIAGVRRRRAAPIARNGVSKFNASVPTAESHTGITTRNRDQAGQAQNSQISRPRIQLDRFGPVLECVLLPRCS